jgi:stress response protein SCP2
VSRHTPRGALQDLEVAVLRVLRDAADGEGWVELATLCGQLPDQTRTRVLMAATELRDRRDIAWYRPSASESGQLRLRLTPTGQREIATIDQLRLTA